jgi:predicted CopG family antitoxin
MKPKLKTIKIREEPHKKLTEIGKKGETFSDVIERLIKEYEKQ